MMTVTKFLNERMVSVLRAESQNGSMIHLYHVNGSWAAVEKSAYFLSRLMSCEIITLLPEGDNEVLPGQIVLASVPEERLGVVRDGLSVMWSGEDYLVLKPKDIPAGYAKWHQENTVDDLDDEDSED